MGTVAAQTIADLIRHELLDEKKRFWTDAELLRYISEGQQLIPRFKPDAFVVNGPVRLRPGTKQTIPADALRLVALPRNLGLDGRTPGRVITVADLSTIDREDPEWHARTPSATVIEAYYDPHDPKHFYVSPPQPAAQTGYVEAVYWAIPPEIPHLNAAIAVDDVYKSSLVDYGCYRALRKLGRTGDGARADQFFQAFAVGLQAQEASEAGAEPQAGSR